MSGVIVHEWISRTGGSENVLDVLVETFPSADVLCLWNDVPDRYPGRTVRETWLANTPFRRNKAMALPFIPATWRNRRPGGYEWALVSSHLFAHHISFANQPEDFRKFVYVHTPARYVWNHELDTRGAGLLPRLVSPPLRAFDHKRAQEPHAIATNSKFVRERVQRAWDRDAQVIYPPVNVERIQAVNNWAGQLTRDDRHILDGMPRQFILGASRFVAYKRLDLVISAGVIAQLPVVLAGSGREEQRLREHATRASIPVHFVLAPSDALLYALYAAAAVFVFPAVEDFGIMPVEAMATGTPVVVGPTGGAQETIIDGVSGIVAADLTGESLARAIDCCEHLQPPACAARAREFDGGRFRAKIRDWVAERQPAGSSQ